ncbi:hypothetical protein OAT67_03610 [Bacteriovoracaceae bacterium]|nr:hypothetical protein [Bacteriovoracaceae bacterium]
MKEDKESKEEKRQLEVNKKIYSDRLKMLRRAQEFSQADDIPRAVECYGQYLNALATYFKVDETKLAPDLFNQETDLAELLLISHVYWDLAKSYDRSPRLHIESIRCLDQFVKFTVGYKYQYANARMLKAFIRKKLAHNPKAFKQTYERIQVESKGCFVATDLFGENHFVTQNLRSFKANRLNNKFGLLFIEFYYQKICPTYFNHIAHRSALKKMTKKLIKLVNVLCR